VSFNEVVNVQERIILEDDKCIDSDTPSSSDNLDDTEHGLNGLKVNAINGLHGDGLNGLNGDALCDNGENEDDSDILDTNLEFIKKMTGKPPYSDVDRIDLGISELSESKKKGRKWDKLMKKLSHASLGS